MQIVRDLSLLLNAIFFGLSIFIALILWHQKTTYKYANRILTVLLAAFAITTLNTILILTGYHRMFPYYQDISNASLLTIGPTLYLFIKVRISPLTKWKIAVHYLPFLAYTLAVVFLYLTGNFEAKETADVLTFLTLIIQLVTYITISFVLLNKYAREVKENFSNIEKHDIGWIKVVLSIILLTLFIRLAMAGYSFAFQDVIDLIGLNLTLIFAIVTCYLGYKIFKNPELFVQLPSYSTSKLSSEDLKQNIRKLEEVIEAQALYRNSKLTISDLAEAAGLQSREVSQTLNQELNQNFFDYINGFRVGDLKTRLQNPENKPYKLQALMNESGFQSPSVAYTAFRKVTGTTPAQFRKQHN